MSWVRAVCGSNHLPCARDRERGWSVRQKPADYVRTPPELRAKKPASGDWSGSGSLPFLGWRIGHLSVLKRPMITCLLDGDASPIRLGEVPGKRYNAAFAPAEPGLSSRYIAVSSPT